MCGIADVIDFPTMQEWRKFVIRAAAFGAGLGLVLVLAVSFLAWWTGRQRPTKPWNNHAITAKFSGVGVTSDEDRYLEFSYVLQNTTDRDFRINEYSTVILDARSGSEVLAGLTRIKDALVLREPIFVPASKSVRVYLVLHLKFPRSVPSDASAEQKEIAAYLRSKVPGLAGFVIFDDTNRYEIDLPSGWQTGMEELPKHP
jgi:hypothetical protein